MPVLLRVDLHGRHAEQRRSEEPTGTPKYPSEDRHAVESRIVGHADDAAALIAARSVEGAQLRLDGRERS